MTQPFEPIAIVGGGCVLPGALDRQQLASLVYAGSSAISSVEPERWRVDLDAISTSPSNPEPERTWTRLGGYVRDFDAGRAIRAVPGASVLASRDLLVPWLLEAARQALVESGAVLGDTLRGGLVAGNLSFPTDSASKFAEECWKTGHSDESDARERFMSGAPVDRVARTLGLTLGGVALDAACASSLYAIELACRRLQHREADIMLAGAVNRADDLFLHVGFCALNAMSRTGRSRPFDAAADGLVPAEGAAVVALQRLNDARRSGARILGVIRGVGLSNDGRGPSFLAPSSDGQVVAIRQAWDRAGLDPATVGYIECHATGTPVGDTTELGSLARVFGSANGVPIGSLKANLGHGITVAGVAGLLKVIAAFERDEVPPQPGLDTPISAVADGGFEVPRSSRAWGDRPRRAAVSAFGFGGNNAHLVVDSPSMIDEALDTARPPLRGDDVVVVAIDAIAGSADGVSAVRSRLMSPPPPTPDGRIEAVDVALHGLRFPPRDLDETLPQQLAALGLARRLAATVPIDTARTSVFVGMGVDAEIARYGLRWRSADHLSGEVRDEIVPPLTAAAVVGTMPNIPANRVNRQLDARGPSFTISSEERSGLDALAVAADGLRGRDVDAAIVLAVDFSDEPVHRAAAASCLGPALQTPGDAVWGCVVVRREDAERRAWPIIAVVADHPCDVGPEDALVVGPGLVGDPITPRFGHAHAASGLAALLAGIMIAREGLDVPGLGTPSAWDVGPRRVRAVAATLGAGTTSSVAAEVHGPPTVIREATRLTGPSRAWPAHRSAVVLSDEVGSQRGEGPAALSPPESRARAASIDLLMPEAPALPSITISEAPAVPVMSDTATQPASGLAPHPVPTEFAFGPAGGDLARTPDAMPTMNLATVGAARAWSEARAAMAREHLAFVQRVTTAETTFQAFMSARRDELVAAAGAAPTATHLLSARGPAGSLSSPASRLASPPVDSRMSSSSVRVASSGPSRVGSISAGGEVVHERADVAATSTGAMSEPAVISPGPALRASEAPLFDRDDLEGLARGQISRWFGPRFEPQDAYPVQVRMPEPPMLLCDRVIDIEAEPATMKTGRIRTETDVTADDWYLVNGRMPAGLMIEAGQADLLLISWLGIDLLTRGERRYRLLGCELTWHDSPPAVGETLHFDIRIDGHARHGDVRLFFFNYTCTSAGAPRLTVRDGQAGFFTEDELDASAGVLWDPAEVDLSGEKRIDPPRVNAVPASISRDAMALLSQGRVYEALGDAWRWTASHTRTPSLPAAPLDLLEAVEEIDVSGGPWGRGYLRAIDHIDPDDWFFEGHFFNDPCMPGTLMLEGCLHAMAAWLIACGHTIDRDGWRFEPVPEQPYKMRCRGQVDPGSKRLVYEVFVREVHDGPLPTVYADLLCTVDGLGAFHCDRMGLRLVPDWPTEGEAAVVPSPSTDRAVATIDGIRLDEVAMAHTAMGRPSRAFGRMYDRFDAGVPVARLPGPPYLCVSRIIETRGEAASKRAGGVVVAEWDVPVSGDLATPVPFAWLLEAGLQPCGWCAAWSGGALTRDEPLFFRNLDGEGVIHTTVVGAASRPDSQDEPLRTRVACTAFATVGSTTIVRFDVNTTRGSGPVLELSTSFGFFDGNSLEKQAGLPEKPDHDRLVDAAEAASSSVSGLIETHFGSDGFPPSWLQMVDGELDVLAPGLDGAAAVRLRRSVRPDDWFFRAHFFQDPVMPGSLGIEGMVQGLALALAATGRLDDRVGARFVGVDPGRRFSWSYRGQVRPDRDEIVIALTLREVVDTDEAVVAVGDASMYVDGVRIYEACGLSARVEGLRQSLAPSSGSDLGAAGSTDEPTCVGNAASAPRIGDGVVAATEPPPAGVAAERMALPSGALADLLDAWSTGHVSAMRMVSTDESALSGSPVVYLCVGLDASTALPLAWRLTECVGRRVTPVIASTGTSDSHAAVAELIGQANEASRSSAPLAHIVDVKERGGLSDLIASLRHDLDTLRSVLVPIQTQSDGSLRGLADRLEPWLTLALSAGVAVVPVVVVSNGLAGPAAATVGSPLDDLASVGVGERRIRVVDAFERIYEDAVATVPRDPALTREVSAWSVNADVSAFVAEAMVHWMAADHPSEESKRLRAAAGSGVLDVDGSAADDRLARLARWGLGPWGVSIRTLQRHDP